MRQLAVPPASPTTELTCLPSCPRAMCNKFTLVDVNGRDVLATQQTSKRKQKAAGTEMREVRWCEALLTFVLKVVL